MHRFLRANGRFSHEEACCHRSLRRKRPSILTERTEPDSARWNEPGAICTPVTCDMQRHRVSACTRTLESSKTTWRERVSQSHAEGKRIISVGIL